MRQVASGNNETRRRSAVGRRGLTPKAKRRKLRMVLFYVGTFLFVITAAMILSLTVLFRIDSIEVDNSSRYSSKEVLEACGIEDGENLFLADVEGARKKIDQALPYTGSVTVTRKIPDTLLITVKEPVIYAAFEQDGEYILVSDEGKILEISKECPQSCLLVQGMDMEKPVAGQKFLPDDEKTREVFSELEDTLSECSLSHITKIDVQDIYKIMVEYDGRIRIQLGTSNDLTLKINAAKKIVEEELEYTEKGELDVSLTRDLKKAYYNADSVSSSSEESVSSQPEE